MSDLKATSGQPLDRVQRRLLQELSSDITAVRLRGLGKVTRVARSLPMYLPSRHPLGRSIGILGCDSPDSAASLVDFREVLPARTVPAGAERTIEAAPLYACSVDRGTLLTDAVLFYGVLTSNNLLVAEVSADHGSKGGDWASFRRLKRLPPQIHIESGASLLTGGGGLSNYGHWLYDVLPRLHVLRLAEVIPPNAHYLVPPIDVEFKHTSLERLGISSERCIGVGRPTAVAADTIAASSGHRSSGRVEPWIPEFLRDAFLPESPQSGLRLYVNRRDTKIRRVLNEEALETVLAQRGFRSISASDFDFQDKLDLYSSAEIIVAPYGAGLANIAFCSPGTHVVQIHGEDWADPFFGDVARATNLRFTSLSALRTVSPSWMPDIIRHLEVDVERVVSTVDDILN